MKNIEREYVIGSNLKKIRDLAGISQEDLALKIGVSRQTINSWEGKSRIRLRFDVLNALAKVLKVEVDDLSKDLTITNAQDQERMIPFYDTMAIGGRELVADDSAVMADQYELIRPGHFFGKATGALRLYGDSMYEKYPSGSIIAYRDSEHWKDLIHFGQDYVIETTDGHRVVKTIMSAESKEEILAVSHNTYKNKHGIDIYRPYTIPKKLIRKMSYVLGIIKFEASI